MKRLGHRIKNIMAPSIPMWASYRDEIGNYSLEPITAIIVYEDGEDGALFDFAAPARIIDGMLEDATNDKYFNCIVYDIDKFIELVGVKEYVIAITSGETIYSIKREDKK